MQLPEAFISSMKTLLGDDIDMFLASYKQPKTYGLRVNPLKYGGCFSCDKLPFSLEPVPWAKEGYYALPEEHPGKHPLHEGGAYYIQEPSAMSVVSLLDPQPHERILDFCAAPGGKSTQIAGRMSGDGLLVSNEIFPSRAKILSQNIERMGITNCIVTNEPPENLPKHFASFFDKILVDAPCSGEGMFRKDNTAITEWSTEQVTICVDRQKMILEYADKMLRPNGVLVYSTCTFAPEEDEKMIQWFLDKHPNYELENWRDFLPEHAGLAEGYFGLFETLRLWPHKLKGEGHFAARLRKCDDNSCSQTQKIKNEKRKKLGKDVENCLAELQESLSHVEAIFHASNYQFFGEELYLVPEQLKNLNGLKILRAGLHLGTRKKNRFEPAHGLAKALTPMDVVQSKHCNMEEATKYLHGETLNCDCSYHSFTLVCYEDISLGWGKASNGTLKNHYPKGLRI